MLARLEIAVKPHLLDASAQKIQEKIRNCDFLLSQKIRFARLLKVYWFDFSMTRDELIPVMTEVCWDPVVHWVFTGNLIPKAAGPSGGLQDLLEWAPYRPGQFWGIEKMVRSGYPDLAAQDLLECFEVILNRPLSSVLRIISGQLLILEGSSLKESDLDWIAYEVFSQELFETWMVVSQEGLIKNDRFYQERIKYELPKRWVQPVKKRPLLEERTLEAGLLASRSFVQDQWDAFFSKMNQQMEKPWLCSGSAWMVLNEQDLLCMDLESLSPRSRAEADSLTLKTLMNLQQKISGAGGLGFDCVLHTNQICVGDSPQSFSMLDAFKNGVAQLGHRMGIPVVQGSCVMDSKFKENPIFVCGVAGVVARSVLNTTVGRGSCLGILHRPAYDRGSFLDGKFQKKFMDWIKEMREFPSFRVYFDSQEQGLLVALARLGRQLSGIEIDLDELPEEEWHAEIFHFIAFSSEPGPLNLFHEWIQRRGFKVTWIGHVTHSGRLEIKHHQSKVCLVLDDLFPEPVESSFQSEAVIPEFSRETLSVVHHEESYLVLKNFGVSYLLKVLSSTQCSSKEWLIRDYDHEIQGTSVIKPLHTVVSDFNQSWSGPNDGGMIQSRPGSDSGIVVGSGMRLRWKALDPFWMAQAALDEAVRNVLCVGADYGHLDSVLGLVVHVCWPEEATLSRVAEGLKEAALALSLPLLSVQVRQHADVPTVFVTAVGGVKSIRKARTSHFKVAGDRIYLLGAMDVGLYESEFIQCCGTSFLTSQDHKKFKSDWHLKVGMPHWSQAQKLYAWLGGTLGSYGKKLQSLHDLSEGGLLVAIVESLLAGDCGASIHLPMEFLGLRRDAMELAFGEGFHNLIATVRPEESAMIEKEWSELEIPFVALGTVEKHTRLEVWVQQDEKNEFLWSVSQEQLRQAWSIRAVGDEKWPH